MITFEVFFMDFSVFLSVGKLFLKPPCVFFFGFVCSKNPKSPAQESHQGCRWVLRGCEKVILASEHRVHGQACRLEEAPGGGSASLARCRS